METSWIDADVTLPPMAKRVLVKVRGGRVMIAKLLMWGWSTDDTLPLKNVVLWRELPE